MDDEKPRGKGRPRSERPDGLAGDLGIVVETTRKKQGITTDVLAERSKLTRGAIIKVEGGRVDTSIGTLLKIAHGLGMSLVDLMRKVKRCVEKPETPPTA